MNYDVAMSSCFLSSMSAYLGRGIHYSVLGGFMVGLWPGSVSVSFVYDISSTYVYSACWL